MYRGRGSERGRAEGRNRVEDGRGRDELPLFFFHVFILSTNIVPSTALVAHHFKKLGMIFVLKEFIAQ